MAVSILIYILIIIGSAILGFVTYAAIFMVASKMANKVLKMKIPERDKMLTPGNYKVDQKEVDKINEEKYRRYRLGDKVKREYLKRKARANQTRVRPGESQIRELIDAANLNTGARIPVPSASPTRRAKQKLSYVQ